MRSVVGVSDPPIGLGMPAELDPPEADNYNAMRSLQSPVVATRGRERELLIFVCQPKAHKLPGTDEEAADISLCMPANIKRNGTAQDLRELLLNNPTKRFVFIGHGDLRMEGRELTLGFADAAGGLCAVRPEALANILGTHAPSPLEFVFLNGCCTAALGRACVAAGVPNVLCWQTRVHNGAARQFSRAFFEAVCAMGGDYVRAFEAAKQALAVDTRPGANADGIACDVPRFRFGDPDEPMASPSSPGEAGRKAVPRSWPRPMTVGIPLLLHAEAATGGALSTPTPGRPSAERACALTMPIDPLERTAEVAGRAGTGRSVKLRALPNRRLAILLAVCTCLSAFLQSLGGVALGWSTAARPPPSPRLPPPPAQLALHTVQSAPQRLLSLVQHHPRRALSVALTVAACTLPPPAAWPLRLAHHGVVEVGRALVHTPPVPTAPAASGALGTVAAAMLLRGLLPSAAAYTLGKQLRWLRLRRGVTPADAVKGAVSIRKLLLKGKNLASFTDVS